MFDYVVIGAGAESYFVCQHRRLACIVLHNTETLQALLWNWNPSASLSYSGPFNENENWFLPCLRHNFVNT